MKQCIKITISGTVQSAAYKELIQRQAQRLAVEGCLQTGEEKSIIIFACGQADKLDDLIDYIYKGTPDAKIRDVTIEPFIQEKNFRGVFRVIGD